MSAGSTTTRARRLSQTTYDLVTDEFDLDLGDHSQVSGAHLEARVGSYRDKYRVIGVRLRSGRARPNRFRRTRADPPGSGPGSNEKPQSMLAAKFFETFHHIQAIYQVGYPLGLGQCPVGPFQLASDLDKIRCCNRTRKAVATESLDQFVADLILSTTSEEQLKIYMEVGIAVQRLITT
ncbi:hypothetical protein Sjap_010282 [Stephania japonica]|uniref:Uncharacterized protein n=1 Tax=Stephania japonica TaxID=461633 RepID=A0AAP0JAX2_9MAGN